MSTACSRHSVSKTKRNSKRCNTSGGVKKRGRRLKPSLPVFHCSATLALFPSRFVLLAECPEQAMMTEFLQVRKGSQRPFQKSRRLFFQNVSKPRSKKRSVDFKWFKWLHLVKIFFYKNLNKRIALSEKAKREIKN